MIIYRALLFTDMEMLGSMGKKKDSNSLDTYPQLSYRHR